MNTAVAIGLAAIRVRHAARGDALMAVLPADHYIEQPQKFREIVVAALDVARETGAYGRSWYSANEAGYRLWLQSKEAASRSKPKGFRVMACGDSRRNPN